MHGHAAVYHEARGAPRWLLTRRAVLGSPAASPCGNPRWREARQREAAMRKIVDTILPDHDGRLLPAPGVVRLSAARAGCARRVQACAARGGLCRRHPGDHPGPGGGRARHRLRRADVLRRLHRLDRLVLLVHVRADSRFRPRQGGASGRRRRRDHDQGDHAALGLGRRGQQRADRRQGGAPAGRLLQARAALREEAGQGLGRRRAGQPRLARLLQALQGPA